MEDYNMLDYNKCEKCGEIKIDDICDNQEFTNDDEVMLCNECIKNMINNNEIIRKYDPLDRTILEYTKKGLEIRIKETEDEINTYSRYVRRLKTDLDNMK
jgi:hypothetical protein